jgi:hypothetical protein
VWVPPGASEARTPDYHLVAYPPTFVAPTQVAWCRSTRASQDIVDEVVAVAAAWGRPDVSFWVGDRTTPRDLAEHLRSRGAVQVESVEVLAQGLTGPGPGASGLEPVEQVPGSGRLVRVGLEVRHVLDAATLNDADLVSVEVWGGQPRSAEDTRRVLEELTDPDTTELRVVAYVDGEPASTAGCTLAAGPAGGCVARLWGGATRSSLRGRGAYRACVGARLALARRRGADLGLVKAVTTTSAPIVRSLGFTAHGVEDRLRLDLTELRHRDA